MQLTSLEAYDEVKKTLGRRQRTILSLLNVCSSIPLTNSEISGQLKWPINTITPRIFELRQKGLVIEGCKRKCGITGRTAIAWRVKRFDEIKERQMEMEM